MIGVHFLIQGAQIFLNSGIHLNHYPMVVPHSKLCTMIQFSFVPVMISFLISNIPMGYKSINIPQVSNLAPLTPIYFYHFKFYRMFLDGENKINDIS